MICYSPNMLCTGPFLIYTCWVMTSFSLMVSNTTYMLMTSQVVFPAQTCPITLDSYVWLLDVSIGMSNKQPQYSTYKLLVFQTQITLPTDLFTSFDVTPSFSYLSQNVGINSAPLFLSYPISDPSSKSVGSTFKIFLESVHFQRPLYLREAIILFSWMTSMLLMAISVPPMPTASYPLWSI